MGGPNPIARSWPLLATLALLFAALAALGLAMRRATSGVLVYPLDDTYIQMAIAKTLAAHGAWGVTRFEFSGAGSSLLWPLLLAGLDRLTGQGARLPLIANTLAAILLLAIAHAGLSRHVPTRRGRALALALLIVAAPLPALALIGMEHTLQCAAALALALTGVAMCAAPAGGQRRLPASVACLAMLAAGVRYDTAAVVAAVVLLIAVSRGWQTAVPAAIAGAVPAAIYAVMAARHGWPVLPAPILLKHRLSGLELMSWHGAADVLGAGALTVLVDTPALLALVIVATALLAASPRGGGRRERESNLLLLTFLIATALHLQFGRVGWLYRYEAYLVVLGVVAAASALARIAPQRRPRLGALRWMAAAALAGVLLYPFALRAFLASRDVVDGARALYRHEYQWSRFFQRYPPDGGLLVGDLGAVSYFTDVPIVDAGGLGTLEMLPWPGRDPADVRRAVRVAQSRGVRVSIIDGPPGGALTGWPGVAVWTTVSDHTADATFWLSAADSQAAAHLARDLRAFAADHAESVFALRFADGRGSCAAP